MGTRSEFAALAKLAERGGIRPILDQTFPLADAARAHERMEEQGQFGKIVLKVS